MYPLDQWWFLLAVYLLGFTVCSYIAGYYEERSEDIFWPVIIAWPIVLPFGLVFMVVYWIGRLPLELGQQHRKGKKK